MGVGASTETPTEKVIQPPKIEPINFPQVEVPRDPNDPEFTLSFNHEQVEEYKKVY